MYKNLNNPRLKQARLKHYYANKEQYLERNRINKDKNKTYLRQCKDVPCMDCGGKYPYYVMDFDHRDPTQKIEGVGRLITYSLKRLKEEIAKCDVVCANCHRLRTYADIV